MTTPVNVNQLFLPSALQIGPGGELISFDATGNPVVIDPSVPGSITINAVDVLYDNTTSGLTATNVQAAIDEIDATVDGILGGGAVTFLGLGDTPASYVGQAGQLVAVNVGETGLEFVAPGAVGATDFLGLTDTPANYIGQAGQTLIVNPGETGLIFATPGSGSTVAGVAIDTATYNFPGDYDGATDDTLAVPTPPAGSEAELFAFFDGIFQNNTSWALINGGNDVQFDAPIPATVAEVELRQIVPDTAVLNMYDVLQAGPFVGDPYDIALPADPGTIENVWIYYNGIHQQPDPLVFSLIAGPSLRISGGVPAGVDEIYIKLGSTTVAQFDIDGLPWDTPPLDLDDVMAISQGGVEAKTRLENILNLGAGGVLLGTVTASTDTSVDFVHGVNGIIFDNTYSIYQIQILDMRPTLDGTGLQMRTTSNLGATFDNGATDYGWSFLDTLESGPSTEGFSGAGSSSIDLALNTGSAAGEHLNGLITIYNIYNPGRDCLMVYDISYIDSGNVSHRYVGNARRKSTLIVDGIRFFMSASTIESGTFKLYGII